MSVPAQPADAPPSEARIAAWLAAIGRNRDRAALIELFRHYAPRIKAFGLRARMDAGAAEELAQETLITLWRKAHLFDPARATASAWVFAIARNKRIDALRRTVPPPSEDLRLALDVGQAPAADEGYDLGRAGERLRRHLAALPPEQAAVLAEAYFEDKTHQAIASQHGLPLGTVKSRIRLALARLRALMEDA